VARAKLMHQLDIERCSMKYFNLISRRLIAHVRQGIKFQHGVSYHLVELMDAPENPGVPV